MVPLSYCFAAFTMLYVIFDLFNNLGDFVEGHTPLASVLQFYVMLIPCSLIYIVPISLMLAVLYCLSVLTKNNELTAMRACGVSLFRMMVPFICVGFAASVVVSVVNETIAPSAAYWTRQFVRSQKSDDKMKTYLHGPLPYRNEVGRRTWMITQFNSRSFEMKNIEVTQFLPTGMDLYKVNASLARWLDGHWWFEEVKTQEFDSYGAPKGAPRYNKSCEMRDFSEKPQDFINEIKDPEFRSAAELLKYLRTHKSISREGIHRFMVDLHSRLAMPWTCLVVTLLGIPFGNQTGRKGALRGVMLCLGMFFAAYVMINVGLWVGKKGLLDPWVAGWAPILAFFALGSLLTFRMR